MYRRFFAQPDFVGFLRFWHSGRVGLGPPLWSGGEQGLPTSFLPNLIIAEGEVSPIYRYVGAECTRRFGCNVTGRRVFGQGLTGAYEGYVRSLYAEVIGRGAPVFSAAIFHIRDSVITTGRLFAPVLLGRTGGPLGVAGLQFFSPADEPLRALGRIGSVHELERDLIAAAPDLCDRLDAARRYWAASRHVRPEALAQEAERIAEELAGTALIPLTPMAASA
jgi:hypothetical protein